MIHSFLGRTKIGPICKNQIHNLDTAKAKVNKDSEIWIQETSSKKTLLLYNIKCYKYTSINSMKNLKGAGNGHIFMA